MCGRCSRRSAHQFGQDSVRRFAASPTADNGASEGSSRARRPAIGIRRAVGAWAGRWREERPRWQIGRPARESEAGDCSSSGAAARRRQRMIAGRHQGAHLPGAGLLPRGRPQEGQADHWALLGQGRQRRTYAADRDWPGEQQQWPQAQGLASGAERFEETARRCRQSLEQHGEHAGFVTRRAGTPARRDQPPLRRATTRTRIGRQGRQPALPARCNRRPPRAGGGQARRAPAWSWGQGAAVRGRGGQGRLTTRNSWRNRAAAQAGPAGESDSQTPRR